MRTTTSRLTAAEEGAKGDMVGGRRRWTIKAVGRGREGKVGSSSVLLVCPLLSPIGRQ
jgi:hypothetical protein